MRSFVQKDVMYTFDCTFCEYRAHNQQDLILHLKMHTGEKPYPCHLCGYRAKNRTGINAHLKRKNHIEIKNVSVNYKCGMCDHHTTNPTDLQNHILLHIHTHEAIRLDFICMCHSVTKLDDIVVHISDHTKKVHQAEIDSLLMQFICNVAILYRTDQAEEKFSNVTNETARDSYLLHSEPLSYNHSNSQGGIEDSAHYNWVPEGLNYQELKDPSPELQSIESVPLYSNNSPTLLNPDTSNEIFQYPLNETNEMPFSSINQLPYNSSIKITADLTCTLCNYTAYTDSDLNYHVSTHSTINYEKDEFICNVCTFKGEGEHELMVHMTTHTSVNDDNNNHNENVDFFCDKCDYMTYSQSNLDLHKIEHEDNGIECVLCGYKLTTSSELRLHMIFHLKSDGRADNSFELDSENVMLSFLMNHHNQNVAIEAGHDNQQQFVDLTNGSDEVAWLPDHNTMPETASTMSYASDIDSYNQSMGSYYDN